MSKKIVLLLFGTLSFSLFSGNQAGKNKLYWQNARVKLVANYEDGVDKLNNFLLKHDFNTKNTDPRRLAAFVVLGKVLSEQQVNDLSEEQYTQLFMAWQSRLAMLNGFSCGSHEEAFKQEALRRLADFKANKSI